MGTKFGLKSEVAADLKCSVSTVYAYMYKFWVQSLGEGQWLLLRGWDVSKAKLLHVKERMKMKWNVQQDGGGGGGGRIQSNKK